MNSKRVLAPPLTLLMMTLAAGGLSAQQAGQLGGGVILGDPIGLTGKYWLGRSHALDLGLGFGYHMTFFGDYLWHLWDVFPQPKEGKLGLYAGGGPLIKTTEDATFGARAIVGVDYWIARQPIELFAEAGPLFVFAPGGRVDGNGGVGVRFYFGGPVKE